MARRGIMPVGLAGVPRTSRNVKPGAFFVALAPRAKDPLVGQIAAGSPGKLEFVVPGNSSVFRAAWSSPALASCTCCVLIKTMEQASFSLSLFTSSVLSRLFTSLLFFSSQVLQGLEP